MADVSVVFICEDGYIIPTCVAITSLIECMTEQERVTIYVVAVDVFEENVQIFENFESRTVNIEVISTSAEKYEGVHKHYKNENISATTAALLKFDLPTLLPCLEKVLYLDGDILVKKSLSTLWDTDVNDFYSAAILDSGKIYSGNPNVKATKEYFNSGVMLLNLKKLRLENVAKRLLETKQTIKDMSLMDQPVFNMVFADRVLLLPIKFNFLYVNLLRAEKDGKVNIMQINDLYGTGYSRIKNILDECIIVHFASRDKPWKFTNGVMSTEWYEMYKKSPVSHIQLNRVKVKATPRNSFFSKIIHCAGSFVQSIKKDGFTGAFRKTKKYLSVRKHYKAVRIIMLVRSPFLYIHGTVKSFLCKFPRLNGLNTTEVREKKVIVSLTSYPRRIKAVSIVTATMTKQTYKPDKIVLYLAREQFPDEKLPFFLRIQQKFGIEIIFVDEDIKPHKKYYYAIRDYPNDIVITVDDDAHYDKDLVECLLRSYKKYPKSVSGMRIGCITFRPDGTIRPYSKWGRSKAMKPPSLAYFAVGVGGILYPPGCMHKELFNVGNLKKTCLNADDIWLKIMQVMCNTPVVRAAEFRIQKYIFGTQEHGLNKTNVAQGQNDIQITAALDIYNNYFGEDDSLLKRMSSAYSKL